MLLAFSILYCFLYCERRNLSYAILVMMKAEGWTAFVVTFASTATGILDCAAYVGAPVQAIFFGNVLTKNGDWSMVFLSIVGVLVVMVIASILAGRDSAK